MPRLVRGEQTVVGRIAAGCHPDAAVAGALAKWTPRTSSAPCWRAVEADYNSNSTKGFTRLRAVLARFGATAASAIKIAIKCLF